MKPRDMTPEKCWSWSLVFAFFFQLPYAASKDCFHREGDWGRPLGLPLLIWTHSLVTSLTKVMFCCGHWYQTVGIVCVKLFVWMSKINTFLSKITTRAFICFVFLSDSKTQNTPHTTHKHKTQNTKHTHTHHKTQNTKHKTHTHTNTTHTHTDAPCAKQSLLFQSVDFAADGSPKNCGAVTDLTVVVTKLFSRRHDHKNLDRVAKMRLQSLQSVLVS